jgi:hypothetical protein
VTYLYVLLYEAPSASQLVPRSPKHKRNRGHAETAFQILSRQDEADAIPNSNVREFCEVYQSSSRLVAAGRAGSGRPGLFLDLILSDDIDGDMPLASLRRLLWIKTSGFLTSPTTKGRPHGPWVPFRHGSHHITSSMYTHKHFQHLVQYHTVTQFDKSFPPPTD